MTRTTTNGQGAPFNGEGSSFDGEEAFMDGLEKLADILTGVAEKLDDLADSYGVSEEEVDELNAGKTEEEIRHEDAVAAMIAAPLVNALDCMSDILEGATEKIMDLIVE